VRARGRATSPPRPGQYPLDDLHARPSVPRLRLSSKRSSDTSKSPKTSSSLSVDSVTPTLSGSIMVMSDESLGSTGIRIRWERPGVKGVAVLPKPDHKRS
jgi:hypothetical protein